ncbi:MAG TPA: phosphate-starvation-inducible PsiE family protein [Xanthobacteraceae bacterium]|nr:phosphate-starvation-inducible PsiE family protein [Xanthobacteraceae bacterium]
MAADDSGKTKRSKLPIYWQFERAALVAVLVMLGVITVFAIAFVAVKLVNDLALGEAFLDKAALQDTFGLILTIVILLEFNHSVYVALTEHSGAIQARIVVLIAILVIARKLMLRDFESLDYQTLLGFGGLLLALGGLYWLISDGDRRRAAAMEQTKREER